MYDFRFLIRSTAADFSSFNFNCKIGSTTVVCGAANSLLITLKGENQFDSFFDLLLLALMTSKNKRTNGENGEKSFRCAALYFKNISSQRSDSKLQKVVWLLTVCGQVLQQTVAQIIPKDAQKVATAVFT